MYMHRKIIGYFLEDGSVIAYLTPTHSAGSVIYKIEEDKKILPCGRR